jgi:acyl-coenzyme A thioesterase PaaI-like protein
MNDGEPSSPIFGRMGVDRTGDPEVPVRVNPYPQVCHRGVVRPSVLVMAIDVMAGFHAAAAAGTDWYFTTDLSLRAPSRAIPGQLVVTGSLLRAGRGTVSSDVRMEVDGRLHAYGQAGFARVPRRAGDPAQPDIHAIPPAAERIPLARPLVEEVGVHVTDAASGRAELALRDELRNPAGVLQGAVVALLAEVAAEALADHHLGIPQIVTDLDVRYLAMGRIGPIEAQASWIGPPEGRTVCVTLRDRGNEGRITTAVLARTTDAPAM